MNPATQSLADGRVSRGQIVVLLIRHELLSMGLSQMHSGF
jgi:hypothetical protein